MEKSSRFLPSSPPPPFSVSFRLRERSEGAKDDAEERALSRFSFSPDNKKVLEMGAEGEGKEREQKATRRPYVVVARLGWRLSPRDIFR